MSKGVVAQYDLENKMTMPQTIGIGGSVKATDKLCIAVDVEWLNWANAFNSMSLSLSNGNSANINRMLGNAGDFAIDLAYEMALNNKEVASKTSTIASEYNSSTSQLSENIFHISLAFGL
jgi:hypothetical protein